MCAAAHNDQNPHKPALTDDERQPQPYAWDAHVAEALNAGINTLVVSWWGRPDVEGTADTQGGAVQVEFRRTS